jgi:hypothetical protein
MKKLLFGLSLSTVLAVSIFASKDMSVEDHNKLTQDINIMKKMTPKQMGSSGKLIMSDVEYNSKLKLITFYMKMTMDFKNIPKHIKEELAQGYEEDAFKNICNSNWKTAFGDFNDLKVRYLYTSQDKVFNQEIIIDLQKDCK